MMTIGNTKELSISIFLYSTIYNNFLYIDIYKKISDMSSNIIYAMYFIYQKYKEFYFL